MRKWIAENRGFLFFLLIVLVLRSAIADWYGVPTSSMYPTVIIGDRILSNRLAYDIKLPFSNVILKRLNDPQRGDIVTFISPEDGVRLVKRVIAVPGDLVEMRDNHLIINGIDATYSGATGDVIENVPPDNDGDQVVLNEELFEQKHTIIITPEVSAVHNFDPITVPEEHYFVLGDNRDNSKDSRYIGCIGRESLTGQVRRIIFSLDPEKFYLPRISRLARALH
jgi:signal peptidase I